MKQQQVWVITAVCLLSLVLAGAVSAAAPAAKLGKVDMARVAQEYQQMQTLNTQFQEFQSTQERQLRDKYTGRVLTDAEVQELTDLCAAAPTEENNKRITELQGFSGTREKRIEELRAKAPRSAEEEAEFKQWDGLMQQRLTALTAFKTELEATRKAKYDELTKIITDNVDAAMKVVAESQKLDLILTKDAVIYGGIDVTDAVLEKLNGPAPK
jgi:Skp family chaperone for outer membrane proteins